MLIDCSYFVDGPRHIQNATLGKLPKPNAEEVNAAIKAYIRMYQRPFLTAAVGATCAADVLARLSEIEKGEAKESASGIDALIEQLREPFANYVFYKILRDGNNQATMTGLVKLKCANEYVAPITRQVSTWNDMVDMMRAFSAWVESTDCKINGIAIDSNLLTKINTLNL